MGIILQQLRVNSVLPAIEENVFTMDEIRSEAVLKSFVDLYRKGQTIPWKADDQLGP
ncbi:MAG: hypothetical protein U0T81_10285 [Saprospiraceae bacterium]